MDDGNKKIINKGAVILCGFPLFVILILAAFFQGKAPDNSYVTSRASHSRSAQGQVVKTVNSDTPVDGISEGTSASSQVIPQRIVRPESQRQLSYMAKQVISRTEIDSNSFLPVGTNAIGKLITGIDTRIQNQFIKVLLPYGASFKGERRLNKDTTLFGTVQYSGSGEKVFLSFTKGVTPEGLEFKIDAQALDPSDYSPGLIGIHHGNADVRIATTLGLSMVSGMAEVMTEKEALGEAGVVTAKSTMENALYHGISKGSELEANRQMGELNKEPEFVTMDVGSAIIVSLTNTFQGIKVDER